MDSSACTSTFTGCAFLPKRQPSHERTGTQDDNVVFMTMPRPLWDFHREYGNDELEAMSGEINADVTTYFMKDPIDFPHWTWIISTSAYRQSRDLDAEFLKRDQDRLGMYIYNDFTGYGIQEVVENLLHSFAIEFKKAGSSTPLLWAHMEALIWACSEPDINLVAWNMIDDGDRLRQTLEQIGLALLSTLNRIELDDLWDAIPNVSLILSMYFAWARTFKNAMHDQTWLVEALVYAEKHSMDVQGVHGIEEVLQEHSTETVDDGCIRRIRRPPLKDKHNFARQWQRFEEWYGQPDGASIGGDYLDITKMTKEARIRYSLNGVDPLEEVGLPFAIDDD